MFTMTRYVVAELNLHVRTNEQRTENRTDTGLLIKLLKSLMGKNSLKCNCPFTIQFFGCDDTHGVHPIHALSRNTRDQLVLKIFRCNDLQ